jgi:hypothetical protein
MTQNRQRPSRQTLQSGILVQLIQTGDFGQFSICFSKHYSRIPDSALTIDTNVLLNPAAGHVGILYTPRHENRPQ